MLAHYRPLKMNYQMLGNHEPHLHAIVSARFRDDVAPGLPIPPLKGARFPDEDVAKDAAALREILSASHR